MSTIIPVAVCIAKAFCDTTIANLSRKRPDMRFYVIDYSTLEASIEAKKCNILFCDPCTFPKLAPQMSKLEWVQSTWAGVENVFESIQLNKIQPKWRFTRMANYGPLLAEYAIGTILTSERQFLDLHKNQEKKIWQRDEFSNYRPLSHLSVAILGVGEVGREIGRICKQFGMIVHGLQGRKKKTDSLPNFDVLRRSEELPLLLSECDYLVNTLPSTSETRNLLGNNMLHNCQAKKAKLINIGRGDIVTETDLIQALDNDYISGATLDVFESEPLPNSSILWAHPKVVITPHVAGVYVPQLVKNFYFFYYLNKLKWFSFIFMGWNFSWKISQGFSLVNH